MSADFDHWTWRLRRWICRQFGHTYRDDDRGAPVIPLFMVCVRCGHFQRLVGR